MYIIITKYRYSNCYCFRVTKIEEQVFGCRESLARLATYYFTSSKLLTADGKDSRGLWLNWELIVNLLSMSIFLNIYTMHVFHIFIKRYQALIK